MVYHQTLSGSGFESLFSITLGFPRLLSRGSRNLMHTILSTPNLIPALVPPQYRCTLLSYSSLREGGNAWCDHSRGVQWMWLLGTTPPPAEDQPWEPKFSCWNVLTYISKLGVLPVTYLINKLVTRTKRANILKEIRTVPSNKLSLESVSALGLGAGFHPKELPLKVFCKDDCLKTWFHNWGTRSCPFVFWPKTKSLRLSPINPELQALRTHSPFSPRPESQWQRDGLIYKDDVIVVTEAISL